MYKLSYLRRYINEIDSAIKSYENKNRIKFDDFRSISLHLELAKLRFLYNKEIRELQSKIKTKKEK